MKQALCLLMVLTAAAGSIQAEPDPAKPIPPAERVQARVWRNMDLQDFRMEGFLRTEKNLHPIVLRTKGKEMVYEFTEKPLQIRVLLTPEGSLVQRRTSSKEEWKDVTGAARLQNILDSDAAYEDLGIDFLRWGNIRPIGEDGIKTLKAWCYEALPPGPSSYAKARYWISADYLAVLRVDAYNSKDQVVKRVEVNGVQQVGKVYVIKEMQISTMVPGREKSSSRTYIEIRKAEAGSGL